MCTALVSGDPQGSSAQTHRVSQGGLEDDQPAHVHELELDVTHSLDKTEFKTNIDIDSAVPYTSYSLHLR